MSYNRFPTMSILLVAIRFLLLVVALVSGFAPSPQSPSRRSLLHASSASDTATALFPVLRRIAGIEWTGPCRYVGADLKFVNDLKLFGGLRYEISRSGDTSSTAASEDNVQHDVCTLSSFLTFPNGKTREVVMTGNMLQHDDDGDGILRLDAAQANGGPIYMILTELAPDTILINEVDSASGKIVMTSSLSLVTTGGVSGRVVELVQVSHEVGDNDGGGASNIIEGHQVWRLKANTAAPSKDSDFDALRLDTTGR
jgi:hypothetical protein